MSTIEARVKKIVVEQLGVKEEEVTNDASFVDDLGADSLDSVELVMALEEEFGIEVPDEDAAKLTTVGAVVDYVDNNLNDGQDNVSQDNDSKNKAKEASKKRTADEALDEEEESETPAKKRKTDESKDE